MKSNYIVGFQEPPQGRNGGDDPWHTDGRLGTVVLRTNSVAVNNSL
jgi:hypothetical protein